MQVTSHQESDALFVAISGQWIPREMAEAIAAARAEADRHNLHRLLVDARGVSIPEGGELDRYLAGVRWADLFPPPFRAAFLVERAVYNGFAELVARNRGAEIAVFFEEPPARKWLGSQP
jgi:hypothetical protein